MVSATLFALSAWIGQWWTVGEVAIGPMGSRHCFNGNCRSGGLAWTNGTELWQRTAVATWAGSLLTMLLLLAIAGAIAANVKNEVMFNRAAKLIAKSTLTALATTAIAGSYFIAKMPGVEGLAIGQGLILFVVAIVLGAVTPIRALRRA